MNISEADGKTVLVVDDQEPVAILINKILSTNGYKCTSAKNGREALDMLHDGLRPDLMLLDIMMPGMDGFELLDKIHEEKVAHETPVVMLTALADATDVMKAMKKGAAAYCVKPIDPDELVKTVNRVLGETNPVNPV